MVLNLFLCMRRLTIEPKSVLVIINIALNTVTNKASLIHGTSSADERIIEYDIDKVVFEARSPFQKIQIMHSKTLGNMLLLDELQSK